MSFPETLAPTTPLDTDLASQGASQIRALKQYLADVFGLVVSPTTQTAAAFAIAAGGIVTISQAGAVVVADPTTALGVATKQYVDNSFTRLYKSNLQIVTNSATPDASLVVDASSNDRWHCRFILYTNGNTGGGGIWTIGVSGPSGATYSLGCTAGGAAFGASPSLTIPFSAGTYLEVSLEAFLSVSGGDVTLTYQSANTFNILSGSVLIATKVTGA